MFFSRNHNNRVKKEFFRSEAAEISNTSLSDSKHLGYTESVKNAVESEAFLETFRADPNYQKVLEHVSIGLGQKYLDEIKSEYNSEPGALFAKLSNLSELGSPPVHNYIGVGNVSPTIIRYVKVGYEINKLFGDISTWKVGEIGVGFGGQAAVLDKLLDVSDYVAFDLPPVLSLFELFLKKTGSRITHKLIDGRNPKPFKVDLVISNYAFSELSRSLQDDYLDNVILKANSGYMIWNNLSSKYLDGYSLKELIRKIPGSRVIKEVPRSARANRLIVWGLPTDLVVA